MLFACFISKNVVIYQQPDAQERPALSKGRKGGLTMNNCDLILHFVDKYILEKEKNIILQNKLEQQKQVQNCNVKTDKKQ